MSLLAMGGEGRLLLEGRQKGDFKAVTYWLRTEAVESRRSPTTRLADSDNLPAQEPATLPSPCHVQCSRNETTRPHDRTMGPTWGIPPASEMA